MVFLNSNQFDIPFIWPFENKAHLLHVSALAPPAIEVLLQYLQIIHGKQTLTDIITHEEFEKRPIRKAERAQGFD